MNHLKQRGDKAACFPNDNTKYLLSLPHDYTIPCKCNPNISLAHKEV